MKMLRSTLPMTAASPGCAITGPRPRPSYGSRNTTGGSLIPRKSLGPSWRRSGKGHGGFNSVNCDSGRAGGCPGTSRRYPVIPGTGNHGILPVELRSLGKLFVEIGVVGFEESVRREPRDGLGAGDLAVEDAQDGLDGLAGSPWSGRGLTEAGVWRGRGRGGAPPHVILWVQTSGGFCPRCGASRLPGLRKGGGRSAERPWGR